LNQTRAKENSKQELPVTLKDFNNSNNQDTLYKEYPLINAETTTDSQFNIQNKKAL
jgi:hypothetical protein